MAVQWPAAVSRPAFCTCMRQPRGQGTRLSRAPRLGFTLIELIVVLAILALLLTIAVPRYMRHVERTKEATLQQDLNIMRDSIDKFFGDKGRYPESLDELVKERYLRAVPVDPITESPTTWLPTPPPPEVQTKGQVYDVRSGAPGNGTDGRPYSEW
jgi:general secretion pathway protein G